MTSVSYPGDLPALSGSNHEVTSPRDSSYNCIAWAAGDTAHFWWPPGGSGAFWPPEAPTTLELASFQAAYGTLGFEPCGDGHLEDGWEKVAVYAKGGVPTHAAVQRSDGSWSSKLGKAEDIRHDSADDVAGGAYGSVAMYMRRPRAS